MPLNIRAIDDDADTGRLGVMVYNALLRANALPDCVEEGETFDTFHVGEATQGPSNLGGLGPDTGEEAMYLYNVGTSKFGEQIDMKVALCRVPPDRGK